jgi:toxin-antitoxin system PIN domain toxin
MIAFDTNILVYAHRRDMPQHTQALQAIQRLVAEGRTWAVPWPCIHEFLAVVTNRRIFRTPTSTQTAMTVIRELGAQQQGRMLGESRRHLDILDRLCRSASVNGSRFHDARIAAICIGHGVSQLWTADRDFSYFPELKTKNPLVAPSP